MPRQPRSQDPKYLASLARRRATKGNAKQFQADLKEMAADFIKHDLAGAATEIALNVRQLAEENSINKMGSEPGAPDVWRGWFAGPVLLDSTETEGGHEKSVAALATWKPGDTIYIWNAAFYSYFHEKGYYSKGGGARPKWMLRDALIAEENTERVL